MVRRTDDDDGPDLDPEAFLKALLRISPEDAEAARTSSPDPGQGEGHEGPYYDYGDDG